MHPLLLLHGAIGAAGQLYPLADKLADAYKVHTLNFSGHGGVAIPDADFSIPLFADNIKTFLEKENLDKVSIFGYSMGGYAAIYFAKMYPEKVDKLITLATKYYWDEVTAEKEVQMLDPDKITVKIPAFAETLMRRHAPQDWKDVLGRTRNMMLALGKDNTLTPKDYNAIKNEVLLLLGDKDKMVGLDETMTVFRALANVQMAVLPNTFHPIEQVNRELLAGHICLFIG